MYQSSEYFFILSDFLHTVKKTNALVFMTCTKVMLSRISFLQNKAIIIILCILELCT